jgi:uncharacterized membrane protein
LASERPDAPDAGRAPVVETRWVERILRGGLAVSLPLMIAGVAWQLRDGPAHAARLRPFGPSTGGAATLTLFAVLLLGATPAVRVVSLIVLWLRERDYRFAGVAVLVAAVLATATLLGRG